MKSISAVNIADWAPRGGSTLRTADGGWLRVTGVDSAMTKPWFTQVRWYVAALGGATAPQDVRMVQTGPVGTIDQLVAGVGADYFAEYSGKGGTFLLARTPDTSQGLVAWRGTYHEAYAWVNTPGAGHATFLAQLDGLDYRDTADGLVLTLTQPGAVFDQIRATKEVPGAGFIEFRRSSEMASSLPLFSGLRVPSGEIWKQVLPNDALPAGSVVLVHASRDVVATMSPEGTGDAASNAALALLKRVTALTWS